MAKAHVSAGVDDRVHLLVEADCALAALAAAIATRGQHLRGEEGGRDRGAERGAGRRHWKDRQEIIMTLHS